MDLNLLTIDAAPLRHSGAQDDLPRARGIVLRQNPERRFADRCLPHSEQKTRSRAGRPHDRRAAEGKPLPPLGGVPVAIKDVLCTRGVRTTAGSKILGILFLPMTLRRWRDGSGGAVVLGKLNCDEFAMGSSTRIPRFHPVRNPRDRSRCPEGPRVARRRRSPRTMSVVTLARYRSSIRQPASFCGVVGLMPTYDAFRAMA